MEVQTQTSAQPAATPPPNAVSEAPAQPSSENAAQSLHDIQMELATKLLSDDGDKPAASARHDTRAADGKFAAKEAKAEPAQDTQPEGDTEKAADPAAEPEKKAEDAPKPAATVREAPRHWRLAPEQKQKWSSLPPDVAEAVHQFATGDRQTVSRLGNQLKAFEPYQGIEKQHASYFRDLGLPAHETFKNFISWDQQLKSDPETAVPAFLKAYGYDPTKYASQPAADPNGLPPDPEVVSLRRTNEQLVARLDRLEKATRNVDTRFATIDEQTQARASEAEQRELDGVMQNVEAFAAKNPDLQLLADSGHLERAIDHHLQLGTPKDQILQKAYEDALWANPTTRDRLLKAETEKALKARTEPARKAGEEAKRAAAVNVRSAPTNPAPPGSVEDAQKEVLRRFGMLN